MCKALFVLPAHMLEELGFAEPTHKPKLGVRPCFSGPITPVVFRPVSMKWRSTKRLVLSPPLPSQEWDPYVLHFPEVPKISMGLSMMNFKGQGRQFPVFASSQENFGDSLPPPSWSVPHVHPANLAPVPRRPALHLRRAAKQWELCFAPGEASTAGQVNQRHEKHTRHKAMGKC